jgi:hypothetical protein
MILKYYPPNEIAIDDIDLKFYESRHTVRVKLAREFEEDNQIIKLGDDEIEPFYMRRDIYKGISPTESFFFLDYDNNDQLTELEVHRCEKIEVLGFPFYFHDELDSIALILSKYSEISILSEGEIFFRDLKMVISDKRKMGGEGNSLCYFYCATDVSHLVQ